MRRNSVLLSIVLIGASLLATPSRAAQPFITAAIQWPSGKAQFFLSDGTYVRYDIAADRADPGYPKPVTDRSWPGVGSYGQQIIAAVNGADPNKAYFFLADGTYLRYDIGQDRVDPGYPQAVDNQSWPGLGPYATQLYAALNWGANKIQFFLNDGTYVRYDVRADRADQGYPKRIDRATWPGLSPYASNLSAAVNWGNGKAYFFLSDGRYLRYDIAEDRVDDGYPKAIDEGTWPGLHGFFRRR